jgi:hypothetical protein
VDISSDSRSTPTATSARAFVHRGNARKENDAAMNPSTRSPGLKTSIPSADRRDLDRRSLKSVDAR